MDYIEFVKEVAVIIVNGQTMIVSRFSFKMQLNDTNIVTKM